MRLNPIKVVKDFHEGYTGFLDTYLVSRYDYLNQMINNKLCQKTFIKGPYIQLTPPYKKGKTLRELVDEGILSSDILKIFPDLHLYEHQEKVIRNIIERDRNALIATGTGSGKTISFLVPVFDYILKNKKEIGKGVKAIFLYPMNALVNDQIEILRKLLKGKNVVTFGKYTGDTPYDEKDFKSKYDQSKHNYKKLKGECPGHLLTREEILTEIPDILITNYSMLEFLLLRPKDNPLFDNKTFKFIVIDEIHVYDGAKGTEIGYLLRRLKSRAFKDKPKCIGASATIGEVNDENLEKAVNFARGIFGEDFEKGDIITSTAVYIDRPKNTWEGDIDFNKILEIAEKKEIEELINYLKSVNPDINIEGKTVEEILFDFFKDYKLTHVLQDRLKENPVLIEELIKDEEVGINDIDKLLDLINILFLAKKDYKGVSLRLLDARYHTFVKGIEGVYVSLNESNQKKIIKEVFLEKRADDEDGHKVFQLCKCSNCGEVFLTGYTERKGNFEVLSADPKLFTDPFKIDKYSRTFIYIPHGEVPFDESFLKSRRNKPPKAEKIWFDPINGHIYETETDNTYEAYRLNSNEDGYSQPMECPNCGLSEGKGGGRKAYWISFFTPQDEYPQANILELLYKRVVEGSVDKKDKKIIVFSDSRKDAAFFAPFFENYYGKRLDRWIIYQNIESNPKRFEKVVKDSARCFALFNKSPNRRVEIAEEKEENYGNILMDEFAMVYSDSLEKVGLARFRLTDELEEDILRSMESIEDLNGLSREEKMSLLYYLLTDVRSLRQVYSDKYFLSVEEAYLWKQKSSELGYGASNWLPVKSKRGYRETKRTKLLENTLGVDDINKKVEILEKIWDILEKKGVFHFISEKGSQLEVNKWTVEKIEDKNVWVCKKCQKIHVWNLKDTCRDGNCGGKLRELSQEDIKEAKALKVQFKPVECKRFKNYEVVAQEHTAQLSPEEGREIQNKFAEGSVNILSCSTTFELGVDLGELEVVFMHNVPPKPDNYVQRAGRAGRSAESVAFVCTYALNRPLDLKAFENPIDFIKGNVRPPVIKVTNPRIILRHLNALSLSHFLRGYYPSADRITIQNFMDNNSFEKFMEYMDGRPQEVKDDIDRVLTNPDLRKEFGVETWQWWNGNIKGIEGRNSKELFKLVKKELDEYLEKLDNIIKDLTTEINTALLVEKKFDIAHELTRLLNIYETQRKKVLDQDIITFFSRKVFIPKYGFPVDVVSLDIIGDPNLNSKLRLDRDLGIAIGEYAPGEKIVALGKVILSTKVTIYEHLKPEVRFFRYCKSCLTFEDSLSGLEEMRKCPICGKENVHTGKYMIPDRGFSCEPFRETYDKFNEKFKATLKEFNIKRKKHVNKKLPITDMKGSSKFISGSKIRTFFKGIKEENKIKDERQVKKAVITPYSRGEVVKLNVSESRRVRVDNGMNVNWFNEAVKARHENDGNVAYLGYGFYTDILEIKPDPDLVELINGIAALEEEGHFAVYLSLLYAIIEGASKVLEIKRDDLDGTLRRSPLSENQYDLIIFDNVPAGAGFIEEIYDNFEKVLKEAKRIVDECSCPPETVCQVCLLHPRNQMFAKFLKRRIASEILEEMV